MCIDFCRLCSNRVRIYCWVYKGTWCLQESFDWRREDKDLGAEAEVTGKGKYIVKSWSTWLTIASSTFWTFEMAVLASVTRESSVLRDQHLHSEENAHLQELNVLLFHLQHQAKVTISLLVFILLCSNLFSISPEANSSASKVSMSLFFFRTPIHMDGSYEDHFSSLKCRQ